MVAARLSADDAGGTVNAGTVSLKDGSITTVDVSKGKLLTLNGNVVKEDGVSGFGGQSQVSITAAIVHIYGVSGGCCAALLVGISLEEDIAVNGVQERTLIGIDSTAIAAGCIIAKLDIAVSGVQGNTLISVDGTTVASIRDDGHFGLQVA